MSGEGLGRPPLGMKGQIACNVKISRLAAQSGGQQQSGTLYLRPHLLARLDAQFVA